MKLPRREVHVQNMSRRLGARVAAFAFDIDGCLLLRDRPLPGVTDTLRRLDARGIPYVFLTNGGGVTEAAKARGLSERLGVPVPTERVLLSHTPMRDLPRSHGLAERRVLGLGHLQFEEVAAGYGFHRCAHARAHGGAR